MNKARILIVEDEGIVAAELSRKLEQLGHEVVGTAERGEDAVALASLKRPDLVLMDILLKGPMDGIEAADRLRREHDAPVVHLTSYSDPATLARAKLTGPFGYVLKPFDERDLAMQIEFALYRHRADRQVREQREWLRVTLNSIGDAVMAADGEGRIGFLNPVAESLTGWKAEEAIGMPVSSVFRVVNEQTGQTLEDPVARVLFEGSAVELANQAALVTRDGRTVPIEDSAAPILDAAGQVIGVVLVFHDVTEKRQAEEAVAAVHRQIQSIIDNTPAIIHAFDLEERFVPANSALARLLKSTPEQMIGKRRHEFMPEEDAGRHEANDREAIESGSALEFEEYSRLKGRSITWLTTKFPLRDAQGRIYAVGGISTDISERKRAEQERAATIKLLEIANQARTPRELTREAIDFLADLSGCSVVGLRLREGDDFPYYDQRGMTDEFLCKENSLFRIDRDGNIVADADGRPYISCMCGTVLCGRTNPSKPFFTKGGSFWINSTTHLLATTTAADRQAETRNVCNQVGWESLALIPLRVGDDTFGLIHLADPRIGKFSSETIAQIERLAQQLSTSLGKLRAEEALRESEERFRLALRNAPVSVAAQDLDLRYIWAYNQRTARPDRIIGHFDHEIFTAEEAEHVTAVKRRVLEEDVELREQMWFNRPSGRIFLDVSWTPTHDAAGRVTGVASATIDLTPIKLAEEKLRESEALLSAILEQLPVAVGVHNRDGEFFLSNSRMAYYVPRKIPSRDPERKARWRIFDAEGRLLPPERWPDARALSGEIVSPGLESRYIAEDGREVWALVSAVPFLSARVESTGAVAVIQDITERKRTEEALRESEERLRMALRAAGAGVWSWNIVNGSIAWSPENYDLYGLDWNHGPLSHSDWERCLHSDDLARANRAVRDTIEGRTSEYRAEFRVVHPAFGVRWLLGVGRVEYAPDGLPSRMLGINLDITERKQAELALQESEERYRSFFENSLDGIFITTPNGAIFSANQAACRMLGYTEEEICRLGRDGIVDLRDSGLTGFIEERSRMKSCRGELTFIRQDGAGIEVELSSGIFKNSRGEDRATIVFRDITERKRMEEEVRKSHTELELRVRERTAELHLTNRALREYARKLERLNAELNEFAWVASHDLQEPLRKIQTFGDRLSRLKDSLDEPGRDDLNRMIKSARRMASLVCSLSSYAGMTREIVTVQPVDLKGTAKEAVSDLEAALCESGGTVEIGELPTIEADAEKVCLLFKNLISNAITYAGEHEKPRIRVTGRVMDGMCRIEVEDNGIGFNEQYLDRIFRPFQRLHGRSSRFEGTGMGLTICRKVVDLHGGTITARSKPGEGSTFIVSLPLRQGTDHNGGSLRRIPPS